jgi:hypothetical protein
VSLRLVRYALLVEPADGGNPAEAYPLGVFSFRLLAAGVVNELFVDDPS